MSIFTLDGVEYNVFVEKLTRSFNVLDGNNSGRTTDGNMHRDIVGTYYNYKLDLSMNNVNTKEYARFYEAISSPIPSHTLTFPYNDETLTFKAYVTKGDDNLRVINGVNVWSGLSIQFVAMEPQRRG